MERIGKLKAFLEENPGDSFLQHALALEYVKIGDDAEASRLFLNILDKEPGYVGSYYHLAQLQARNGETDKALSTYETGMQEARKASDNHAYNELMMAKEELEDN